VPAGTIGTIWFRAPPVGRFEYFGDEKKTQSSYDGDWFTMRDMGYQDEDGYVFLTGRTSELIISGGVNIYPAEIDAVLLMHPAVADAAAVGVPNEEFGEEVRAVVRPTARQARRCARADGALPRGRVVRACGVDFDPAPRLRRWCSAA
jgi:long-chain acyl-CoA synthetase